MLNSIKREANVAYTENGAVTLATTGSDCLDLFATIGALRRADDGEIVKRFIRAFAENRDIAMKLLFFARDIRGGLGERRVFRVILRWLADNEPASVRKNIRYIAEYGRYDDIFTLMGTAVERDALEAVRMQLNEDLAALERKDEVSLLAKWLPSINTSSAATVALGKKVAAYLGLNGAEYRRTLSRLRGRIRIIENHLRERDYTFDYSTQPSKAMFKYRRAFMRNDGERYNDYLGRVSRGEATLHADTLAPYELVDACLDANFIDHTFMRPVTEEEANALNTTWASLPDFGGDVNALTVIDTSGSMYFTGKPRPASVALSLGLYFAERNKGRFANHFIEFSSKAQLIEIKGKSFVERLRYIASFNKVANTNLQAVFDLILDSAVKNGLPESELPEKLILISDMEFDACVAGGTATNFERAKKRYAAAGYKLPEVIFWNVASRNMQQPVKMDERGVALVSGCTPRLFEMVAGGIIDPYAFMMEVVESERYAAILA